jgi:isoleucyl-tRNA synthetase
MEKKLKIDANKPLSDIEHTILDFWEENKIFEQSLELRRGNPKFTFYDGPPFANGLPHYGHVLAMSIKDLFVRYKTMRGYFVPRRNGWDTHGLPVEYQLEKKLGISGKKAIQGYGVAKFNREARLSVMEYADIWTTTMRRMGRWIDFGHEYKTYESSYIESVWWVFKQLWDKKLIYKDFAVQPYCPRCETSLSNFETNQGYKEHTPDPSVFIKFKLADKENEYFLAWTTTPWTLPANTALAVGGNIDYGLYEVGADKLWLAQELASKVIGEDAKQLMVQKGSQLVGSRYELLFRDYFGMTDSVAGDKKKAHRVHGADFVSLEEGTGIVHIAPAYGEDDMKLARQESLPVIFSTDLQGRMLTEIAHGQFIKKADRAIIEDLKDRGLVWQTGTIHHTYPFCWRCDTPLVYMAMSSWFLKVTALKNRIVELNKKIKWQPSHLRDGRFGKWLEGVRDWNIGRSRFWGAPIPVWECDKCQARQVIGSVEALGQGQDFDPHKPQIDKVTLKCSQCGGMMHRVDEVFDCWFESGSMPYAQWHYPFENQKEFNEDFPADFIAEGIDQTRGWFYTLHVLGVALFDKPAFKNVVVNGIIQAEDGQKLSKRLRNYPEPSEVFDEFGVDALRQYLYSATQIGEDYRFSKKLVAEEARKVVFPLWNSYLFCRNYLGAARTARADEASRELDRWMIARLNKAVKRITQYLDNYDLTRGSREVEILINDLSLWYLRLSRKRQDKDFVSTLRKTLKDVAILTAPFMPFMAEAIYNDVKLENDPMSVHLVDWPHGEKYDEDIIKNMLHVRKLVELGHALRAEAKIKVRQPLSCLNYEIAGSQKLPVGMETILLQELNVKKINKNNGSSKKDNGYCINVDIEINDELAAEGNEREIVRTIQAMRKEKKLMPTDRAQVMYEVVGSVSLALDGHWAERVAQQTNTEIKLITARPKLALSQRILLSGGEVILYMS